MHRIENTFEPSRRDVLRLISSAALGVTFASSAAHGGQGGRQLPHEGVFELGDLRLESGVTLPNAKLGYKTHGRLNADSSNVILYPTPYPAQHGDIEWLIGPGRALDPDKNFIIVLDQLGNGLSSSPSNTPSPLDRMNFPIITIRDDVAAQHRLVSSGFGIRRVALVTGWSMGAQQTFQWAVSHPDMVERIVPFCGTAKTTPHNAVFLQSVRSALIADAAWMDGNYKDQPVKGVRAFSHVYAGWAFSQPFYKQGLYRHLGFTALEDFITGFWETRYARRDANNLLSMLRTWQLNDLGGTTGFGGSLLLGRGEADSIGFLPTGATCSRVCLRRSAGQANRQNTADVTDCVRWITGAGPGSWTHVYSGGGIASSRRRTSAY
jgi:homoserine O-acetyltransferase